MGLPAITLKRLEQYVRVVQGLIAGDTVDWTEEGTAQDPLPQSGARARQCP